MILYRSNSGRINTNFIVSPPLLLEGKQFIDLNNLPVGKFIILNGGWRKLYYFFCFLALLP